MEGEFTGSLLFHTLLLLLLSFPYCHYSICYSFSHKLITTISPQPLICRISYHQMHFVLQLVAIILTANTIAISISLTMQISKLTFMVLTLQYYRVYYFHNNNQEV